VISQIYEATIDYTIHYTLMCLQNYRPLNVSKSFDSLYWCCYDYELLYGIPRTLLLQLKLYNAKTGRGNKASTIPIIFGNSEFQTAIKPAWTRSSNVCVCVCVWSVRDRSCIEEQPCDWCQYRPTFLSTALGGQINLRPRIASLWSK